MMTVAGSASPGNRRRAAVLCLLVLLAVSVITPVTARPASAAPPVRMSSVTVPLHGTTPSYDGTGAAPGWVTSEPVRTDPFAMVGLELASEAPVEVRTARDDSEWSAWIELPHQHDEGPDPTGEEGLAARPGHRTQPVFVGESDRLQVRSRTATDVTADLIDPFGFSRSWAQRIADRAAAAWAGPPTAAALATVDMPPIVTRAQWGADESIVRRAPSYSPSVERAFVHHTVGSNDYSQAQAPGVVRGIMAYHVNGNGWSDIGYNFLVDRFGTIYEGRAGGVTEAVIGAQAGGFNTSSTGVALMGTYTSASPGSAALAGVARVIAWKADVHHVDPLGTATAISAGSSRYAEGTAVVLDNVSGHRDVSLTGCPGDTTYAQLNALRQQVRERAGDLIVDDGADVARTRVIRGDPDVDTITVSARLDPPGGWTVGVRDSMGAMVHQEEGDGAEVASTLTLTGDGWPTGPYTWTVSSDGRRPASGTVSFLPPTIEGLRLSSDLVTLAGDGTLDEQLAVHADLWPGAGWQLRIEAPDGQIVHLAEGQGEVLDAGWTAGATVPGTYLVHVSAEDAAPVTIEVEVRYDLLDRLGDAEDPIGGAALISGATFGPDSADRAVIARHDVFADALAGGPLTRGMGPLMLTTSDALDDRVVAELDRVLAPGAVVYVLGGSAAIEPAVVDALAARYGTVVRIAGSSRFATAAAIAQVVVEESGATTAMVARAGPDDGAPWADALSGGAYGAWAGVPVLLSDGQHLSSDTATAIQSLGITDTIVLGGTAALGEAVASALPRPIRLAGADRTATGVEVARQLWATAIDVDTVVLANGYEGIAWAWALAAAPLSAREAAPLLITTPDALVPATATYLEQAATVTGGVAVGPERLLSDDVVFTASERIRGR